MDVSTQLLGTFVPGTNALQQDENMSLLEKSGSDGFLRFSH